MFKVLTCAFVLASFALIGFFPNEANAVTDIRVECPERVSVQLHWEDWAHKPQYGRFVPIPSNHYPPGLWAPFRNSQVMPDRLTIQCLYTAPTNILIGMAYGHAVGGKIISCVGVPGRIIWCKVE